MKLVCDKSGVILYYISTTFKLHLNTFSNPTHFMSCSVIKAMLQTFTHLRYADICLQSHIKTETLKNTGSCQQAGAAEPEQHFIHQCIVPSSDLINCKLFTFITALILV